MSELFADVAVDLPLDGVFTYRVPCELHNEVELGRRVLVPFRNRMVTGYVVEVLNSTDVRDTREIKDVLDERPLFDKRMLDFFRWLSSYYFAPMGEVLSLTHPSELNVRTHRYLYLTEKGLARINDPSYRDDHLLGLLRSIGEDGISVSALLRGHPRSPVYHRIGRLKREGLVREEVRLRGGRMIKTVTSLSMVEGIDGEYIEKVLRKKPLQLRICRYLLERGESTLAGLRAQFGGGVSGAVRGLEKEGIVRARTKEVRRNPLEDLQPRSMEHEPSEEQRVAVENISRAIRDGGFSAFLLYGVTGSGKTLVYMNAIDEVIRMGRRALYLIPEIALTPWPASYLSWRFGKRVSIFHSGLSDGERYDEWRRIVSGEVDVVVGTRSSLFLPVRDLGLIIVDEEHDPSYKQEEGIRYNARDSALMLAKHLSITVVLGSATPSVETFYRAKKGILTPLFLRRRPKGAVLPEVEIVDMRKEREDVLSGRLRALLSDTLKGKKQSILFINRRGFSGFLICRDCGHTFGCLNCSVTLTFHKGQKRLRCHYCDLSMDVPDRCPECGGTRLLDPGAGTEKVEEEVKKSFPGVRIERMDRDTVRRKDSVKRIISAVEQKRVDVLVGTQMVSKGHHFPDITLVGIVSGDTSLSIPDFRSAERTFQLISQASGRAGRDVHPGRVIIQTLNPDHYCFRNAISHDYEGFFREEINHRRELLYPPFSRMCKLRVEGNREERVVRCIHELRRTADGIAKTRGYDVAILGPAPAVIWKLKGRFRWQMLLKGRTTSAVHALVRELKDDFKRKKTPGITLTIDMDPVTTV